METTNKKSNSSLEKSFHYKLFSILENEEYSDIIAWDPEGLRIEIKDREKLAEVLLPLFCNHKNPPSFFRQLHYYGFKHVKEIGGARWYAHPLFQKGKKELLTKMARSKPIRPAVEKKSMDYPSPVAATYSNGPGISELLQELQMANLMIQRLREENQFLHREAAKMSRYNYGNFPYVEYPISKKQFGESGIPLPSRVNHQVQVIENQVLFQSNARAMYAPSERLQRDPIDSYIRMGSSNLDYNSSEQYPNQLGEQTFFLEERNFF